jgi:hypothetical protein
MGQNSHQDSLQRLIKEFSREHLSEEDGNRIIKEAEDIILRVDNWLKVGEIMKYNPSEDKKTEMLLYKTRAQQIIQEIQERIAPPGENYKPGIF